MIGSAVEGHIEHGQRIKVNGSDWDTPLSVAVTETVSVAPPSGGVAVAVAVKVAVDEPAVTFTVAGTVKAPLSAETDTPTPAVGAGAERLMVQIDDAPVSRTAGLQASAETTGGAIKANVSVWDARFKVAVTVACWLTAIVPRLAPNDAEVLLAGTVTDNGTVSAALLLESPTTLPPAGAASFNVTMHAVDVPELTLAGVQARKETTAGSTKVTVAICTVSLRAAVTVALWVDSRVPASAVKLPLVAPASTVTDAGIVSRTLLSDSVTEVLEEGA